MDSAWPFQLFWNLKIFMSQFFDWVIASLNSQLSPDAGGWTWHFCHLTNANKNGQSHKKWFSTKVYVSLRQVVYIPTYIELKQHDLFARWPSSTAILDLVLEIWPFLLHFWNKHHEYNNFYVQLVQKFPMLKVKINIKVLLVTH